MSKISVDLKKLEGTIEADAQKFAAWLKSEEVKISGALKDVPDLVALIESVDQALTAVSSDVTNPLQLILNPAMTLEDFQNVWAKIKQLIQDASGISKS